MDEGLKKNGAEFCLTWYLEISEPEEIYKCERIKRYFF